MALPKLEQYLPELMQFTAELAAQRQNGTITDWQMFSAQVRTFFTPAILQKTDQVASGWIKMSEFADQQTLIHVTSVLTALRLLPEYLQASSEQRTLIEWTVLFHDVAKVAQRGKHDYIHGFRSAAITGRGLRLDGFPVTLDYPSSIDEWFSLTWNAILYRTDLQEITQDNGKLPEILAGIDRLFGANTPAVLIIKSVLFHMSIVTDPDYPTVAPLTDAEIVRYIDAACFPILKMMMLVDTDGWDMFDPTAREHHRRMTLEVFDKIALQIGLK